MINLLHVERWAPFHLIVPEHEDPEWTRVESIAIADVVGAEKVVRIA